MIIDPNAYLRSLSDEQAAAALKTDDPVMIIAGAGSGKTRTLVGRFIHLLRPVAEGGLGADPSSIMMVTFTNKAAREMRERITPLLEAFRTRNPNMQGGEPWIGTFHGLSLRILRIEAAKAGLGSNFSIFDDSDARALANDVAEQLDLDAFDVDDFFSDLEFAKARLLGHELLAQKKLEIAMARMSGEELGMALEKWNSKVFSHFKAPDFPTIYSAYQRALEDQNAVDFSDLMNRVTKLFTHNEEVRNAWASSFRHFMIDEVQDINRAQVFWLNTLTGGGRPMAIPAGQTGSEHSNASDGLHEVNTRRLRNFPRATVAFVGDDDQSIYAFRGSDVGVMRDLENKYPGLDIKFLRQSYRCQASILSTANKLVANNSGRYDKSIEPADRGRARSSIIIEEHATPNDEIRRIAAEANAHIGQGLDPKEFAVLVRTRDMVKAVARELRAAGLPVSEGKASDIRKTAEVRDAMSLAGFIVNPDAEVLLRRIINKPSRGLGPTSTARVSSNAKLKKISFIEELRTIMRDKIDLPEGGEPYKTPFVRSVKQFGHLIVEMRRAMGPCENAGEAMRTILEMSGYLPDLKSQAMKSAGIRDGIDLSLAPREFLSALIRNRSDSRDEKAREREALDLQEMDGEDLADRAGQLSETARRIGNLSLLLEQASVMPTLEAFMQEATLEMDQQTGAAGIQVMTVHSSKGLEFDKVRMPFMIDGVFPHGRAVEEGEAAIEEERRLCYVGMTRAKEDLRMSRSWKISGCAFIRQRNSMPSRFIDEIRRAPKTDWRCTSMKPNDRAYRLGTVNAVAPAPERPAPAAATPAPGHTPISGAAAPVAAAQGSPLAHLLPGAGSIPAPVQAQAPVVTASPAGHASAPQERSAQVEEMERPFAPITEADLDELMPDYGDMVPDYEDFMPDHAPLEEEADLFPEPIF